MSKFVTRFLKDESGATAIEYGLIAVVLVGALQAVGTSLGGAFDKISSEVSSATGA